MAISETVELLGKGLYDNIPNTLTLKGIPTSIELETVGNEDFDKTMLEIVLPQAVEEKIDFGQLLEIDFQWILRCLRLLNYGPYHSSNAIFCDECNKTSFGDYLVDLRTIECKPLPPNFRNDLVVDKDEFIDFDGSVHLKLLTVRDALNAKKDKAFQDSEGNVNSNLARICYSISSIKGNKNLTPVEIKLLLVDEMSSADYMILKGKARELSDYGLRSGGVATCPKCGNRNAAFIAFVDDRFFRPSMGALLEWKNDRSSRRDEDASGSETAAV